MLRCGIRQLSKPSRVSTRFSSTGPVATPAAPTAVQQPASVAPTTVPTLTAKNAPKNKAGSRMLSTAALIGAGLGLAYLHDSRAGIYRWALIPLVHKLTENDMESAHQFAVNVLASGLGPVDMGIDDPLLEIDVLGQKFANPIGIAAGFDKNALAVDALFKLGFSYVEIGSVTPQPQAGNPKPRVFRVPESKSILNRYGFNSDGHDTVLARFQKRIQSWVRDRASTLPSGIFPDPPANAAPDYDVVAELLQSSHGNGAQVPDALGVPRSLSEGRVLGINLGKNKISDPESIDDFVDGVTALGPFADMLVINVSSPNTPGLRGLQSKGVVDELLEGVVSARNNLPGPVKPPVLVKIAPDLTKAEIQDIAQAVLNNGVDGVIVSNTTISRPEDAGKSQVLQETGGLSGPPVKPLALRALRNMYEATEGKITIIGCGGITTGEDAIEFAKAGASLVQVYTGMVYEGFGLPRKIKDEVTQILTEQGKTWKEIIGLNAPKPRVLPTPTPVVPPPPVNEEEFTRTINETRLELEALLLEANSLDNPSLKTIDAQPVVQEPKLIEEVKEEASFQSMGLLDDKAIALLLAPEYASKNEPEQTTSPAIKNDSL